ncbi:Alpha/beta hydrolase fold-1, partial [Dillenia turbinata]
MMISKAAIVLMMSLLGFAYQAAQPPPPNSTTDSSPDGEQPPFTSLRIRLDDGRCLAYRERGVPRKESKHQIIIVHGFGSSKEMNFQTSQELVDELEIYFVFYDRAGYGESDPNPKSSVKSEAMDIQELADQLEISKFYVLGVSLGSYPAWSCLKHIPHRQKLYLKYHSCRLAGVALIVPVINYYWPSLPEEVIREDYRRRLVQYAYWISSYAPGLFYWWLTQNWFPSSAVLEKNPFFFSDRDINVLKTAPGFPMLSRNKLRENREAFELLKRDFLVAFGDWEFDPLDMSDPFPHNESSVHIWQGYEDRVVPVQLQRHVSERLPWIHYHEVPHGGHLLIYDNNVCEAIVRALLLGEDPIEYRPHSAE